MLLTGAGRHQHDACRRCVTPAVYDADIVPWLPCGFRRSKSACDVALDTAEGMPLAVEFAVVCGGFGARDLGIGGGAMALPIRDLGFLAATSLLFSLASNLLAKKLTVLAKVLMSSTACSTLPLPEAFSITSINRRSSSRSVMPLPYPARLGPAKDHLGMISTSLQKTAAQIFGAAEPISNVFSYCHPFWRTPHCLCLLSYRTVTQRL